MKAQTVISLQYKSEHAAEGRHPSYCTQVSDSSANSTATLSLVHISPVTSALFSDPFHRILAKHVVKVNGLPVKCFEQLPWVFPSTTHTLRITYEHKIILSPHRLWDTSIRRSMLQEIFKPFNCCLLCVSWSSNSWRYQYCRYQYKAGGCIRHCNEGRYSHSTALTKWAAVAAIHVHTQNCSTQSHPKCIHVRIGAHAWTKRRTSHHRTANQILVPEDY